MQIFVGLGNPGGKYAKTRHNIGFMAVDRIAEDHGFSPWRARFQGEVAEGRLGTEKVLLLKPQTFMNLSGQSVGEAMRFFKLEPGDVTVFHDELDLAPGKCRVKTGGGHAGHNGLRSIHQHIGEAYHRIRLGIGHPGRKEAVAGYVLHEFAKAEEVWLDDLMRGISDGAKALATGDKPGFQNAVALRVAPPRSSQGTGQKGAGQKGASQKSAGKPGSDTPTAKDGETGRPQAAPEAATEDSRSPLQKLADKFR